MTPTQNKPIEFHFRSGHLKSIQYVPEGALALIQRYDPLFASGLVPMGDDTFVNSSVLTLGAVKALKDTFQESGFKFINVLDLYDKTFYDRIDQLDHVPFESNPS